VDSDTSIVDVVDHFSMIEHMRLGQTIDVEIVNAGKVRFFTKLVGCKDGKYLILELPDENKYGNVKEELTEENWLIVRTILEHTSGMAVAFESLTLSKTNYPARLFFVKYPETIVTRGLRREDRQQVKIKAQIYQSKEASENERIEGHIVNISSGGCCFECNVGKNVRAIKQKEVFIELDEPLEGYNLVTLSEVRSQRKIKQTMTIGLAFQQN
jgi:c-di-GMP-binding flagellar brake protein YcgR